MTTSAAHQQALSILRKYPKKPAGKYAYGTAGFRFEIDNEDFAAAVFVRAGMVACARAKFLKQTVGLCVTASHNPVKDNGVKLIDPDGGMLAASWESIAAAAANANTEEECLSILLRSCNESQVVSSAATVYLGRDTRPHSERLEKAASEGIKAFGGIAVSFGVLTTPQLHFCVMRSNGFGYVNDFAPTLDGYKQCLVRSYSNLVEGTPPSPNEIHVDCANGVGAVMFPTIAEDLKKAGFRCTLFNTEVEDFAKLNEGCGAEHLQKLRLPPAGMPVGCARYASFDGDADRIVFYSFAADGTFRLLDGDKIASLIALFIKQQTKFLFGNDPTSAPLVTIGTVQTAYANGSSSKYLKSTLEVDAPFVKTGVKYLHHKALEYDVGIYFEANGHGTALFKPAFVHMLRGYEIQTEQAQVAKKRLIALAELFNQATGDAFSDLLAVDAMLRVLQFDDEKWNALYSDLPSRQLKVKVVDRSCVVTTEDETRCVKPERLQEWLDKVAQPVSDGRVFVRPSGTEDVVRVYAEAETQKDADYLADEAVKAIMAEAGGIPDAKKQKSG